MAFIQFVNPPSFSRLFAIGALFVLRVLALAAIVQQALAENWQRVPILLFWLLLTYSAGIIGNYIKLSVPVEFEALVVAFVFATMFLGEFRNFYDEIRWWDSFLHIIGSALVVFAAYILFTRAEQRPLLENQPFLLALFCFCFAVSIGALWEIYEFFMDLHFGLNMQPAGNSDTMWDTIWNVVGAASSTTVIYIHKTRSEFAGLQRLMDGFMVKDGDTSRNS